MSSKYGSFLLLLFVFVTGGRRCLALMVDVAGLDDPRSEPATADFVNVMEIGGGYRAIVVSRGGVLSAETVHRPGNVYARQLSNGEELLQLIFGGNGELLACELSEDQAQVSEFRERYQTTATSGNQDNGDDRKLTKVHREMTDWKRVKEQCEVLQEERRRDSESWSEESPKRTRRSLTLPGTTWCGMGNVSQDGSQANGVHGSTDRCCRAHDHCDHTISGFSSKYGLFNFRFHTISHCECDDRFRTCLRMANDENADFVGRLFFNILRMKCFVLERETACLERAWWGRCIRQGFQYKADTRESVLYYTDD